MTEQTIKATDATIREIVEQEIERLGNEADLNHIDVSAVTDMSKLFQRSEFNGNIAQWDVSNVVDMTQMFRRAAFKGDLSKWNVSNVKSMSAMFFDNKNFIHWNNNHDVLSQWDVSNVEDMWGMFSNSEFMGDLTNWNLRNVRNTEKMFFASPLREKYGRNGENLKR